MLVHRVAELRRQHDAVSPPFERAPDEVLARALAVDVGGVEERDAGLERGVDHGERPLVVTARTEVVRAEADDRYLGPALSECSQAHRQTLPERVR